MTKTEEFKKILRETDEVGRLMLLALTYGVLARRPKDVEPLNGTSNGTLKRHIRDFRILQSRRPEDREDLETAITFLRECLAERRKAR